MTKVQTHLIGIALKKNKKLACYLALLACVENRYTYLDNAYAMVRHEVSPQEWAGYLSALTKDGKYQAEHGEYAGHWGTVR